MITLQDLIFKAPSNNTALLLSDEKAVFSLVQKCESLAVTKLVNMASIDMRSLSNKFADSEVVILTNIDDVPSNHELLYQLSYLLDVTRAYVFCTFREKGNYLKLQANKDGPLYLRWYWIDEDFEQNFQYSPM